MKNLHSQIDIFYNTKNWKNYTHIYLDISKNIELMDQNEPKLVA